MIKLENVIKRYPNFNLGPVNLNFDNHETHVLLGSSGCGKTTILRMIMGLVKPSEGTIYFDETPLYKFSSKQLSRKIGYVIQEGGLFPHMNAFDNMALPGKINGLSKKDISKRVDELVELCGLSEEVKKKYPHELSGGQRQRVGLSRGLFLRPEYLLLDEPLGALDPVIRKSLQIQLKEIFNKLNMTVFMVTHDVGEGAFFGKTISLFKKGRLVQHGQIEDLAKKPQEAFVTKFLEAAAPNERMMEAMR